ncbi:hypothetical protein OC846_000883 [Tilletia horrida]|uniref:Uncharacterized protein n=1 Tax=Tilletia horrida TaxID=155126 RepID=A0AAN6GU19_9BASI|nr:hypothetical protein OC845_001163 [Tilletia horrida]KAK0556856.1 hypothetical protein OC846_000883 [Tilletia horrida]
MASAVQWESDSFRQARGLMGELLSEGYSPTRMVRDGVAAHIVAACCQQLNIPYSGDQLRQAEAESKGLPYIPSPRTSVERSTAFSTRSESLPSDDLPLGASALHSTRNSPFVTSSRNSPNFSDVHRSSDTYLPSRLGPNATTSTSSRKRKERDSPEPGEIIVVSDSSDEEGEIKLEPPRRNDKGKTVPRATTSYTVTPEARPAPPRGRRVVDYNDTASPLPHAHAVPPAARQPQNRNAPPPPQAPLRNSRTMLMSYPVVPAPGQKLTKGQKKARRRDLERQLEMQRAAGITFEAPPPPPPGYVLPRENANVASAVYTPVQQPAPTRNGPQIRPNGQTQAPQSHSFAHSSSAGSSRHADSERIRSPPPMPRNGPLSRTPARQVPRSVPLRSDQIPRSTSAGGAAQTSVRPPTYVESGRSRTQLHNASVHSSKPGTLPNDVPQAAEGSRSNYEAQPSQAQELRVESEPEVPNRPGSVSSNGSFHSADEGDASAVEAALQQTPHAEPAEPVTVEVSESEYEPTYVSDQEDVVVAPGPPFQAASDPAPSGVTQLLPTGSVIPSAANVEPVDNLFAEARGQHRPEFGTGPRLNFNARLQTSAESARTVNSRTDPAPDVVPPSRKVRRRASRLAKQTAKERNGSTGSNSSSSAGVRHNPVAGVASLPPRPFLTADVCFDDAIIHPAPPGTQRCWYIDIESGVLHYYPEPQSASRAGPQNPTSADVPPHPAVNGASEESTSMSSRGETRHSFNDPIQALPTPPSADDVQDSLAKMREAALASMLGKRKKASGLSVAITENASQTPPSENQTPLPSASFTAEPMLSSEQARDQREMTFDHRNIATHRPEPILDGSLTLNDPSMDDAVLQPFVNRKQVSYADPFPSMDSWRSAPAGQSGHIDVPQGDLDMNDIEADNLAIHDKGKTAEASQEPVSAAPAGVRPQRSGRPTAADFFEGPHSGSDRRRGHRGRRAPFLKLPEWEQRSYCTIEMAEDSADEEEIALELEGEPAGEELLVSDSESDQSHCQTEGSAGSWQLEGSVLRKQHLQEVDNIIGLIRSRQTPTLALLRDGPTTEATRQPLPRASSSGTLQIPLQGSQDHVVPPQRPTSATSTRSPNEATKSTSPTSQAAAHAPKPAASQVVAALDPSDTGDIHAKLAAYQEQIRQMKEQMARLEEINARQKAMDIVKRRRAAAEQVPSTDEQTPARVAASGKVGATGSSGTTTLAPTSSATQELDADSYAGAEEPVESRSVILEVSPDPESAEEEDGEEYIPELEYTFERAPSGSQRQTEASIPAQQSVRPSTVLPIHPLDASGTVIASSAPFSKRLFSSLIPHSWGVRS